MSIPIPDFSHSRPVRLSLARGLAQETCRRARAEEADVAGAFRAFRRLAPNRKSAERIVGRLRRQPGVVLAGTPAGHEGRATVVLRNASEVVFRDLAEEEFAEGSLIYTRMETWAAKGLVSFLLYRVTISPHALQRLVERSLCALEPGLLPAVDAEVRPLFRALRMTQAELGDKIYARSEGCEGLWIGCLGRSPIEDDWGLARTDRCIPTLAVRTFLDEEHMSPMDYLRWKGDQTLTVQ